MLVADDLIDPPVSALLPGRVGLFVRLVCRPGGRPGILDILNRYADRLGEEPGTEAFLICLDPDDADIVWLYEWFQNPAALEAHRAAAAFVDMMTEMPDLLASPPALIRVDPLRANIQRRVLAGETLGDVL
jgi:quinol monooxygenase YgiN